MQPPVYGIDFGTSNSSVALSRNGSASLLNIGAGGKPTERSVIFFPAGRFERPLVGEQGVEQYIRQGMQGRLIQSLKSMLPDLSFTHTAINEEDFGPEDLTAVVLHHLKRSADVLCGEDVRAVVLGRPAVFSAEAAEDRGAEERLVTAAYRAGFEQVQVQLEPVAAALAYETHLQRQETVFVADLGAGTCDFAVVRLDPSRARSLERKRDVLATGGVHIAGDDFDSAMMWHKLTPRLGRGARFAAWNGPREVPAHVYAWLCRWERVPFIRADRLLYESIRELAQGEGETEGVAQLLRLVDGNLGYAVFRSIERAKMALSAAAAAVIDAQQAGLRLRETVRREEFEQMIAAPARSIRDEAGATLRRAGLAARDIDALYITGGTSLVPLVRRLLAGLLGREELRERDTFTSVAEGLALSAPLFEWR